MAVRAVRELAALLAVTLAIPGCGPGPLTAPPEIESESDGEMSNLVFWLQRHDKRGDGSQTLVLAALANGRPVGFDLELAPWQENGPGLINVSSFDCKGHLKSQGAASDELVAFLEPRLAAISATAAMAPSIETQVVAAFDSPGLFEKGKVRIVLPLGRDETMGSFGDVQVDVEAPSARVKIRNTTPQVRRLIAAVLAGD